MLLLYSPVVPLNLGEINPESWNRIVRYQSCWVFFLFFPGIFLLLPCFLLSHQEIQKAFCGGFVLLLLLLNIRDLRNLQLLALCKSLLLFFLIVRRKRFLFCAREHCLFVIGFLLFQFSLCLKTINGICIFKDLKIITGLKNC